MDIEDRGWIEWRKFCCYLREQIEWSLYPDETIGTAERILREIHSKIDVLEFEKGYVDFDSIRTAIMEVYNNDSFYRFFIKPPNMRALENFYPSRVEHGRHRRNKKEDRTES